MHRWMVLLTVTALCVVVSTPHPVDGASGHSRVALLDGDHEPTDLYVVTPEGSSRRLPGAPSPGGRLEWVGETGEIVYTTGSSNDPDGATRAVSVDTGIDRQLADRRGVISPDLRWVSYRQDGAVWLVEVATGARRQLTRGQDPTAIDDVDLSWDASSYRIAFRGVKTHGEGAELYLTDITGSPPLRITPLELDIATPVWSPDGRWVGFRASGELWKVRADGSELTQLTSLGRSGTSAVGRLAWSPDGSAVATAVERQDSDGVGLYVFDADGSAHGRRVSPHGSEAWFAPDVHVAFADDGRSIVHDVIIGDSSGQTFYRSFLVDLTDDTVIELDGDGRSGSVQDRQFQPMIEPGITRRSAGLTRVLTAVQVSRRVWGSASTVVLARADLYPDALAGRSLAGKHDGPVLLSAQDHLSDAVGDEIQRLGATTAYLLGDRSALAPQVEADLAARGVTRIRRLAGPTRFETAAEVAREVTGTHVYIVEGAHADPGRGWPDAVAVAALAAHQQRPVLLVTTDELPDATRDALLDLDATHATIIGGPSAVSQEVADELRRMGLEVDRIAGRTRYETSRAVADASVEAGLSAVSTWLATGRNWPDSLAAGPAAAAQGGVLLLADGQDLDGSPPVRTWLDHHAATIRTVRLVGGSDVVTPGVAVAIERQLTPP